MPTPLKTTKPGQRFPLSEAPTPPKDRVYPYWPEKKTEEEKKDFRHRVKQFIAYIRDL